MRRLATDSLLARLQSAHGLRDAPAARAMLFAGRRLPRAALEERRTRSAVVIATSLADKRDRWFAEAAGQGLDAPAAMAASRPGFLPPPRRSENAKG